jgi:hypothetical protein
MAELRKENRELLFLGLDGGKPLVGPERQHPGDWERREALWKLAQSDSAGGTGPMKIVEAQEDRTL